MVTNKKIVWSVDPTQNPNEAKGIVAELKTWARFMNCEVQPVAIFSKSNWNLPVALDMPWHDKFEALAKEALARFLASTNADSFLPPIIKFVTWTSNRRMARELIKYVRSIDAEIIFLNTKSVSNLSLLPLGSFTEAVVTFSETPILLFNPSATPTNSIENILFPTDFSEDSKTALAGLVPLAKAFDARVTIFNQVTQSYMYPSEFYNFVEAYEMESVQDQMKIERIKLANQWAELLKNNDIKTSVNIKTSDSYVVEDILEVAQKQKVDLIAMACRSGTVVQMLIGSVSRDIIFKATVPVLIFYRPKKHQKVKYTNKTQHKGFSQEEVKHG